jgi:branched-chain amino acid transport system substrate-binding protein
MDETVFGRYQLLGLLGEGGMGQVYKAFDTEARRAVALKVLPLNMAQDRTFQERFRREAYAAASLNEPHVVPIHSFGEIDGRLYLDMRLIEGIDLQTMLASGELPGATRAVHFIDQVAGALDAAHAAGLVHRDVKPSNMLIAARDFVYLIDFGIARAASDGGLTTAGNAIGTFPYMAPERFTSQEADHRSDVYALACVLYECLTGQQPFPGSGIEQQIAGHMMLAPPQPSATRSDVPRALDQVIAMGMAKDPSARYQSATALADAARAALTTTVPNQPAPQPYPESPPTWAANAPPTNVGYQPRFVAEQPHGGQGFTPTQHRGFPPQPPVPPFPQFEANYPENRSSRALLVIGGITAVVLVVVGVIVAIPLLTRSESSSVSTATDSATATPSGTATSGQLQIVGVTPIDSNGREVASGGATAADPAGDGKATCPPLSIATAGALTGVDAALGINIKNGVQLAINQHNAANPGCQVQLKPFDTGGDPQKATAIAPQIVDDQFTVGLVGPAFSGETKATGTVFDQAGLVAATASATNVTLSENGWKTFIRGLANDGVQGPSVANYLRNTLGYKTICVIDDGTNYGLALATGVRETLGPVADSRCNISVRKGDKDFSAAVTQIKGVAPDAVFYGGYYAEAAPLVRQLRDGGVTATFVSADGTKDPEFVNQAGESSRDTLLACPCGPVPKPFADEYFAAFGQPPGTYSPEGYDLATIMLKGIDAGAITRPALLDFVHSYAGQGIAHSYQWTNVGELTSPLIWMFKVE